MREKILLPQMLSIFKETFKKDFSSLENDGFLGEEIESILRGEPKNIISRSFKN